MLNATSLAMRHQALSELQRRSSRKPWSFEGVQARLRWTWAPKTKTRPKFPLCPLSSRSAGEPARLVKAEARTSSLVDRVGEVRIQ